jgi:hypothetical protein
MDPLSDRYQRRVGNAQIETAWRCVGLASQAKSGSRLFLGGNLREIQKGVEMTRIHDPRKANEIESWALQLELTSQVLPMDAASLREYSRLIHGRRIRCVKTP